MANWFPPDLVQAMADRYRDLYAAYAITGSRPLPSIVEALAFQAASTR